MGKSVKIKISAILVCLVLVLITGCGGRGVSEESAEAKRAVPIVTYPVIPMKGEMIKNADDKATDDTADAEDEESDTDREAAGATEVSEEADEETGAEAVKAESADNEAAGADTGYADGSETSGAGEGYADGQDNSAASEPSESVSDMGDSEYTDDSYEQYGDTEYSEDTDGGYINEDEEYIEPLPKPSVPEPEAEETGEADASGDGEVLGESLTYLNTWTISFYCPCVACTNSGNGITASGTYAQPWHTAATDGLEFGTTLYVDGLGYFVVEDRGTSYGWLDVFVADHNEALNLGLQSREVYLVN